MANRKVNKTNSINIYLPSFSVYFICRYKLYNVITITMNVGFVAYIHVIL